MRILLVEDEEKLRRLVALHLEEEGHEVRAYGSAEEALEREGAGAAELVITDLKLPGMDGLSFLGRLREMEAEAPVIVMTAFGNIDTAVAAMKQGALDFLQKPFSLEHLSAVVEKAASVGSLRAENRQLKEQLTERYQFHNLIGRSPGMQEVFHLVERVAPSRATVLICGESGVGKDMVARAIHWHSTRRDKPMVKINCSALPENLMESELFGYERGAFTGATIAKPGKFEQADEGTVFLDEIGDVPLPVQVKLLRILQEREFERLGSNRTKKIDVRVIAATNADLRAALEEGRFREDLYYRLNVLPINVPPLRERTEDIVPLAKHFLAKFGGEEYGLRAEALEKLLAHDWPGNVRELENVMERSVLLAEGKILGAGDIHLSLGPKRASGGEEMPFLPANMTLDEYERAILREALRRAQGNKSQAARLLGITRNALRYRLTQMGEGDGEEE
ncbi:MAG: sigma-54 dependent transcriptional regulator [Bryobacter sp.]|nr:sigma-54 dependent transcriptional regulator [Bryobacter sp.]